MSELFDKQMNAQKEFEKILPRFTQAPASPQKRCVMKMKETRKNDMHIRCCWWQEATL